MLLHAGRWQCRQATPASHKVCCPHKYAEGRLDAGIHKASNTYAELMSYKKASHMLALPYSTIQLFPCWAHDMMVGLLRCHIKVPSLPEGIYEGYLHSLLHISDIYLGYRLLCYNMLYLGLC